MKFKIIDTIEGVKQFNFSDSALLFINENYNLIRKGSNGQIIIAESTEDFKIGMSALFCFTRKQNDLVIYKNDKIVSRLEGPFFSKEFFDNGESVVVLKEIESADKFFKIDASLKPEPFDWNSNFLTVISGEYFLARNRRTLSCHVLSNGKQVWQLDLNEAAGGKDKDIISKLVVYSDKLFFVVTGGDVLCVEMPTGKIAARIPFSKAWLKLYGGLIYGVKNNEVGILNPTTLQYQTIDLSMALSNEKLTISSKLFIPVGDELYFVDSDVSKVAVAGLSTGTLLWHADIPIEEGHFWIKDIKVNDGRLYVWNQGGTLRVFEKE